MPLDDLDGLALLVADGVIVDWGRLLDAAGGPAELAALQLIETIGAGHRADPDPPEAP